MVEFETLDSREIRLDKGLIVVSAKKAISERGETEFLAISKADNNGRFKQTVTIPRDAEVVDEIAKTLKSVV